MAESGWGGLHDWHVERGGGAPLFRQIYLQVRGAILARRLRPGAKLPSSRVLAGELGVARASVVQAFEQLLAEGYVVGKVGAGTFIASDLPEPVDGGPRRRAARKPASPAVAAARPHPPLTDAFADAIVDGADKPFNAGRSLVDARTVETWRRLTVRASRRFDPVHLGYSDPRGLPVLREAVADYLRAARAVRCEPDQILITGGTQHGIDLAMRVLLNPGDGVWVEDPGYPMTSGALAAAGLRLVPVPVDAHGLDVAAGIRAAPRARAAFVTPSHQFPLGVVLSMARRLALLAWARDAGAWIVEDDYQSEFRYGGRPLAALQGLDDAERVIYVGTFNKALFPGLRLGYLVVPSALLRAFVGARQLIDRQPATLHQTVVAEFMRQGYFAAHVRRMRQLYRGQRDALVSTLRHRAGDALAVAAPDQGMHLVAHLAKGLSETAIARAAAAHDLVIRPLSPLYHAAPPRPGFLLGFTGYPKPVIVPAAARLAALVRRAS